MTYKTILSELGFVKGNWAAFILSFYENSSIPTDLRLDSIAVSGKFRGKGIGSILLDSVAEYAKENHYERILLDVIDTNPRAKKLYESKGYKTIKQEPFPYLRWLLNFGGTTTLTQIIE